MNDKVKFWIRFVLWAALACVLPVVFIAYRFELFEGKTVSISGFGVLAIIIIAIFVISLIKYVRNGLPYSMTSQCITGICKVTIPLLALFGILWCIRNNIDNFIKVVGFVLISETVAIPINPMPAWVYKNATEEQRNKFTSWANIVLDNIFRGKKGEE
jgi:hypothetical protein